MIELLKGGRVVRYFYVHARDPVSSFTHYIGLCCAAFGSLLLVLRANRLETDKGLMFCAVIFGVSLMLLYAASTIYHFYNGSDRVLRMLRKLDHAIIYVLIAGTYTPIVAHSMDKQKATVFLIAIWTAAILGIAVKLCWMNAPRPIYTALYLIMGWSIVFDWQALATLEPGCVALVAAGGLCYSAGAVVYMLKRPVISENFGFHEVFHLFVLAGSLLHYLAVFFYVLQ